MVRSLTPCPLECDRAYAECQHHLWRRNDGTALPANHGDLADGRSIPASSGGIAGSCTVTVDVTAPHKGRLLNTLVVNALNTTNGNNTAPASATLTVNPVVVAGPAPPPMSPRLTSGA